MGRRLINITFHGIGTPGRTLHRGEDRVWVSLDRCLAVLDAAAERDDVRVTFDDGNASDIQLALPALLERGLTATFFVLAGRLDTPRFLGRDDVRTLAEAGMTIGSHGMDHVAWRGLSSEAMQVELVETKHVLEDVVGAPVNEAACPFGAYERRSLRGLQRAGYTRVYTSDRGPANASEWLQARTTITEHGSVAPILTAPKPTPRRRLELFVKRWR